MKPRNTQHTPHTPLSRLSSHITHRLIHSYHSNPIHSFNSSLYLTPPNPFLLKRKDMKKKKEERKEGQSMQEKERNEHNQQQPPPTAISSHLTSPHLQQHVHAFTTSGRGKAMTRKKGACVRDRAIFFYIQKGRLNTAKRKHLTNHSSHHSARSRVCKGIRVLKWILEVEQEEKKENIKVYHNGKVCTE